MRVAASNTLIIGSNSMSERASRPVATMASSSSNSFRRTFFHRMLAQSAISRSGASRRWRRSRSV